MTTIHDAFAEQSRLLPDAVALVYRGHRVSYRTLDEASDVLAAEMYAAGVRPGGLVPVVMDKSERLVAVLLAVLKCGAGYAALDPRWPDERINAVIEQLDTPLFAGDGGRPGIVAAPMWVAGPESTAAIAARGGLRPAVSVSDEDVATVFFTSGTTGLPKGVLSPHRATTRLFHDCGFARFGPDAVMPAAAPVPWDAFSLELWGPLLTGGTCVLVEEPLLLPAALRRQVAENGVNTVWLTTSVFNLLVDEDIECFAGIRDLMAGGERLSPEHVRRFLARHPGIRLTNGYGPVESCVFATTHPISASDCDDPFGIPIGRAVSGTRLHVLDERGEPCAPGEVGELCVEGTGLALGYLGGAAGTANAFSELILDGRGRRIYRTGDLCHGTETGLLYFHGRADRQVKIRGHRVEPAELEQRALGLPFVAACRALPYGTGPGFEGIHLVVVGAPGHTVDEHELRVALAAQLPPYLMPTKIVIRPALPLTVNGKVDDDALRAAAGLSEEPVAQRRASAVANVFADVLGRTAVPSDASLFDLGGTSLDVGRISARLDALLGVAVPMSKIVELVTADRLQRWVDERAAARSEAAVEGPPDGGVPLVGSQQAILISDHLEPELMAYLCPMVWRIEGDVDRAALAAALQDVSGRHQALHWSYQFDPRLCALPPAGHRVGEFVELPRDEQAGGPLERLMAELYQPLDPAEGRMWRAAMVTDRSSCWLGVVVHHVGFDGGSESVLAADLSVAYQARLSGITPRFAAPAPTMAAIVERYRRQVDHEGLERQRAYWRAELHNAPRLEFPGEPSWDGGPAALEESVCAATMDACAKLASELDTTLVAVLLAAFSQTLQRTTGQDDFTVGVPVSRRSGAGLDSAISCLMDIVCLRLRLGGATSWRDLLDRCRAAVLSGFAHSDVAVDELALLAGRGGMGGLYQAMLILQDQPAPDLRLPGCETRFQRPDPPEAVSDLVVEIRRRPDGGADIHATFRPNRVPAPFAQQVPTLLRDALDGLAADSAVRDTDRLIPTPSA